MLDLKLDREGVTPKDAATVILVRDATTSAAAAADGGVGAGTGAAVEVFCVERSKQSRFMGGAIVFPGGKLDAGDASDEWSSVSTAVNVIGGGAAKRGAVPFTTSAEHHRALAIAACRETLEEAAILPLKRKAGGGDDDDAAVVVTQDDLFALRDKLKTDPTALRAFLVERALLLDLAALRPLARWVTPAAESRRYDARFFVAIAPKGQTGAHDEHETMASFWATPREVLRRYEAGEVQLAPPTHCTLSQLAQFKSTTEILALTAESCLDPICPRLIQQKIASGSGAEKQMIDVLALALPGDPEHEIKETRAFGPSRYVLRGERWQAENAPKDP